MPEKTMFKNVAALLEVKPGTKLGETDWIQMSQALTNAFAEVTGDRQFIHTDPEAAAKTMFKGTVVHGYHLMAMAPDLLFRLVGLERTRGAINYGGGEFRFPESVPTNGRIKMRAEIESVKKKNMKVVVKGALVTFKLTFHVEGKEKPALVMRPIYWIL